MSTKKIENKHVRQMNQDDTIIPNNNQSRTLTLTTADEDLASISNVNNNINSTNTTLVDSILSDPTAPSDVVMPPNWESLWSFTTGIDAAAPTADGVGNNDDSKWKAFMRHDDDTHPPRLILKRNENWTYTEKVTVMMIIWNGVFLGITCVTEIYWLLALPHHLAGYLFIMSAIRAQFNSTYMTVTDVAILLDERPITLEDCGCLCVDRKVPVRSLQEISIRPVTNFYGIELPFYMDGTCKEFTAYQVCGVVDKDRNLFRPIISGLITLDEANFVKTQLDQVLQKSASEP